MSHRSPAGPKRTTFARALRHLFLLFIGLHIPSTVAYACTWRASVLDLRTKEEKLYRLSPEVLHITLKQPDTQFAADCWLQVKTVINSTRDDIFVLSEERASVICCGPSVCSRTYAAKRILKNNKLWYFPITLTIGPFIDFGEPLRRYKMVHPEFRDDDAVPKDIVDAINKEIDRFNDAGAYDIHLQCGT